MFIQKSKTENVPNVDEILDFPHHRFKSEKCIGEGSYGIVEKVLDKQSGEFVAIKTMKMKEHDTIPHFILREISLLVQL